MASHTSLCLFLALFTAIICSAHAYRFVVGGKDGWVLNPSENYSHWAEKRRFQVNDTLFFKYKKGADSVLVVTKDDYEKCKTEKPIKKMEDGDSVFKFDRSGPFYFISGKNGSCENGQKLIVVVLAVKNQHKSPPVALAPAPVSQTPTVAPTAGSPFPTPPTTPVSPAMSPKSPSPTTSPMSPSPVAKPPIMSPTPAMAPTSPSPAAIHNPVPSPSAMTPGATPTPAIVPMSPLPANTPAVSPAPAIIPASPSPSPSLANTPAVSPAPAITPASPSPSLANTPAVSLAPGSLSTSPSPNSEAPTLPSPAAPTLTPSVVLALSVSLVLSVAFGDSITAP